jgi:hypothetical protein
MTRIHPEHYSVIYGLFAGLAALLPFGYLIKSFTEPPNWFFLSKYYPWLTFTINETVFVLLAVVSNKLRKMELKKHAP